MKRIVMYLIFSILAIAVVSGAAIAFAQEGSSGPGSPGGPGRGAGGEVTSIDGSTINVKNPRGEVAIITTDSTEFVVNDEAGSLDGIQVGMFVHAEGERNDDDTFTATRVTASDEAPPPPPGGPCGPGRGAGGEVTSIDGTTINVKNPRGEQSIITTDSTEFIINGEAGSLAGVQTGMFVRAEGERNDDHTFTATRVNASDEAPPPPPGGPGKDQGASQPPDNGQEQ